MTPSKSSAKCRIWKSSTSTPPAITDKGIQTLTAVNALRRLDLSGTKITDESLVTFGKLESLNVRLTNVTPQAAEALKAQCPSLEVICDTAPFAP